MTAPSWLIKVTVAPPRGPSSANGSSQWDEPVATGATWTDTLSHYPPGCHGFRVAIRTRLSDWSDSRGEGASVSGGVVGMRMMGP